MPNDHTDRRKTFVIDTNVLMYNPEAVLSFTDNEVVIPLIVLEELDQLKDHPTKGLSAREAIRQLSKLLENPEDNTSKIKKTPGGGTIYIDPNGDNPSKLPEGFDPHKPDNIILLTASRLTEIARNSQKEVILVSKDMALRAKAMGMNIVAQDFLSGRVRDDSPIQKAIINVTLGDDIISTLHRAKPGQKLSVEKSGLSSEQISSMPHHACLRITGRANGKTCLALLKRTTGTLELINKPPGRDDSKHGIFARNDEQAFALALALSPDVTCAAFDGVAGSGKTLMALYAAWQLVLNPSSRGFESKIVENQPPAPAFEKVVVYRPTRELGEQMGYLPGPIEEKFAPWEKPIWTNLKFIAAEYGKEISYVQSLREQGKLEVLPINHIRGETWHHSFVIIDEAQNLTPLETKTLATRLGEGSRIIWTGDRSQVDTPSMDSWSNGLVHLISRLSGQPLCANLELIKSERSSFAALAAELL